MDVLDSGSSDDDSGQEQDPLPAEKRQKSTQIDVATLNKHGYSGAPSVLLVPEKHDDTPNWAWSSGTEKKGRRPRHEDFEERERNRAAVSTAAEESARFAVAAVEQGKRLKEERWKERAAIKERDASWKQKEKRKRELGQQNKGKNYVEEEKRRAREFGVVSGFD